jgi:hypothetical protein
MEPVTSPEVEPLSRGARPRRSRRLGAVGILRDLGVGVLCYATTGAVVALGMVLGIHCLELKIKSYNVYLYEYRFQAYENWDGQWYKSIAAEGYRYDRGRTSNVAFYPAYPLATRAFAEVTGFGISPSLALVSNLSALAAFCLLALYARARYQDPEITLYALISLGLIPTSFFLRMAYSESMFLLAVVLVLVAVGRRWPLLVVAGLIGLTTAVRPVGIALIPPFFVEVWRRRRETRHLAMTLLASLPLCCWGALAFTFYQSYEFDDPLAFVRTQALWSRHPPTSPGQRIVDLATLEPIRALFEPASRGYWGRHEPKHPVLLSLHAAGPVYFLAAVALTILGAARRWLTTFEWMSSLLLLIIPYCTNGYTNYFLSMGRCSLVAIPVYLVLGHLLARAPAPLAAAGFGISGFYLGAYAALFASWHKYI